MANILISQIYIQYICVVCKATTSVKMVQVIIRLRIDSSRVATDEDQIRWSVWS